ncbi:hypothetical protein MYX76_14065 [Desulfobacterota bacterium AH_259_B03_O07]|nr:hypothetical protein [Desulfobacterota bacterium AH_259_B03_O07]
MRKLIVLSIVALALSFTAIGSLADPMSKPIKNIAASTTEVKGQIIEITDDRLILSDEEVNKRKINASELVELEGLTLYS